MIEELCWSLISYLYLKFKKNAKSFKSSQTHYNLEKTLECNTCKMVASLKLGHIFFLSIFPTKPSNIGIIIGFGFRTTVDCS
jgi:hypothetical protein